MRGTSITTNSPAIPSSPAGEEAAGDEADDEGEFRHWRNQRLSWQRLLFGRVAGLVEFLLLLLLLLPLEGNDLRHPETGNTLFRDAMLAFLVIAAPGLIHHAERTAVLIRRSWPLLAVLAWFLLTSLWAPHPELTLRRGIAYVTVYLIGLSMAASSERPSDFQGPALLAFAFVFLANAAAAILLPSPDPKGMSGIYTEKNMAGQVVLCALIVLSASLFLARRPWTKAFILLLLPCAWAFLIATQAKTALGIAVLLAALLPFLAYVLTCPKRQKAVIIALLIGLTGTAIFFLQLYGVAAEDIGTIILGDLTLSQRTPIWAAMISEIGLRPWTGYGFGSFWATGQPLNPFSFVPPDAFFANANGINEGHNGYLDIAMQTGLIGLALCLLVILRCIWNLCAALASPAAGRRARRGCAMMLGLALAMVLGNITESLIFQPSDPLGYLFVLIAAQAERWRPSIRADRS